MQALSSDAFQKAFARAARPIAVIGAVGGFIGDIIQPLGDFALWIAAISLIGAIAALIWIVVLKRRAGQEIWDTVAAGIFVVCVGSFVVFSVWTVIFSAGPERGYLATNVPAIGDLQAQLLGLQKDVTEIKETTTVTATRVAEQGNTQAVQATAQAQGFADIQAKFAELQAGQGTIRPNPQTPQEWYSNARLYQLKGDTANAIQAYEGYFKFNLDFVDPYLDYIALLKATEGIARTRQMIDGMYSANKASPTLDLISTSLLDVPTDRTIRLAALTLREPLYGPGFLELSAEYNRAYQKTPTNDLGQKQKAAFDTAVKLETESQGYTRYFIDKPRAEKNLSDMRSIITGAEQFSNIVGKVEFTFLPSYDGLQIMINLPEAGTAQKLLFSIDDPEPKTDTGKLTSGSQSFVNTLINGIKLPVGEHTIYVQYIDVNGTPSQVYSHKFVVEPIGITITQQPPDFSTNLVPVLITASILDAPQDMAYTYKYSIDSDALDQQMDGFFIATLNPKLKPGDHTLYIQATDKTGKSTAVVKYPFTIK